MSAAPSLRDRVLALAAERPSLTRRQARRVSAWIAIASAALGVSGLWAAGGVDPSVPLNDATRLAEGCLLLAALVTAFTFGEGPCTVTRAGPVLRNLVLLAPLALYAYMRFFASVYEPWTGGSPWTTSVFTLAIATPPFVALLSLRGDSSVERGASLGALIGATCGSWANVLSILHDLGTAPRAAFIGHVAPLAMLMFLGAAAGLPPPGWPGRLPGRWWEVRRMRH